MWIRIDLASWIRIRIELDFFWNWIRIGNPDSDPDDLKLAPKKNKITKLLLLNIFDSTFNRVYDMI